jgi:hypothetical protein
MNKEEMLMQLNDLLYNFKNCKKVDSTKDDVQALEYAIKEIERTAQEVPVQEQSVITIDMDKSFVAEVNEKLMSITSELNELLEQTPKVVTSQSF